MADYFIANTNEDYRQAALLFKEYAEWINIDLSFQHFNEELNMLKTMYNRPQGGIILSKLEDEFAGCIGIRKISADVAELKRMFVKPRFQKCGIGKQLLEKAIELARSLHYNTIRLDTLDYMTTAINLYKQYNFYEIPAYYNNPNQSALYFELRC